MITMSGSVATQLVKYVTKFKLSSDFMLINAEMFWSLINEISSGSTVTDVKCFWPLIEKMH